MQQIKDMTQIRRLLTRLNEGYGKLDRDDLIKKVNQEPLKKIPPPPQTYIDLKAVVGDSEGDERNKARELFYREHKYAKGELEAYVKKLREAVNWNTCNSMVPNTAFEDGPGIFPIEKKEGKWLMIYDFDADRDGDMIKIYIPLNMDYWGLI